jgi:hypothetical protein
MVDYMIFTWYSQGTELNDESNGSSPQPKGKKRLRSPSMYRQHLVNSLTNVALGNASPTLVSRRRQTIAPQVYISAYRASAAPIVARLDFEPFEFIKTTCCARDDGSLDNIASDKPEMILIVKGWQRFIGENDLSGAYLGTGHSKYAFKVSIRAPFAYHLFTGHRANIRAVIMRSFKGGITTHLKQIILRISAMS